MSFIFKAAEAGLSHAQGHLSQSGILDGLASGAAKVQEGLGAVGSAGAGLALANEGRHLLEVMSATAGMAQDMVQDVVLPAAGAGLSLAKEKMAEVDVHETWSNAKEKVWEGGEKVRPYLQTPFIYILLITIQAGHWATNNPKQAAAAGIAVSGLAMVAAPGLVTVPLLNAMGFSSGGVVGGSVAAGVQSVIGNVAAGSAFAIGQSAGAGGAGLAIANMAVQVPGAAILGGGLTCLATGRCEETGEGCSKKEAK
jgi:hypothetical protein